MVEQEELNADRRFSSLIAASKDNLNDNKLLEIQEAFQDALKDVQHLSYRTKHLYEEFLRCLARLGKTEELQRRLEDMKSAGISADEVTYGILINELGNTSNLTMASQLFRQAEDLRKTDCLFL